MTPETTRHIIRRMLQHLAAKTTDVAAAPMSLDGTEFLDEQRWRREQRQLFLDVPQVIGFAGQVAGPNTYFTTTVLNRPVVVTRAGDGVLRAFINACAHRGAEVAEGQGTARRLNCKFHGWSYQLDGRLAGRREEDAFAGSQDSTSLIPLPVAERAGLILVGVKPDMPQSRVDTALGKIEAELEGFDFQRAVPVGAHRYEVAANWKLVTGLSHEGYHFATLHRQSLAPLMHDAGVVDTFGHHSRWAFALRGIENLADTPEVEWPSHFPGAMNHTIFPGTVIVVNPDDAEMIRVEPGAAPGESVVFYSGVARNTDKVDACREAFEFGGQLFTEEDLPAAAACQRGLNAGLSRVVIGRNEPVVQFWHRLWNEALANHDA